MRIPCVCVVALLSAMSSAQTTHIVGPGGFAQVNDALAVAAPGDEIVVLPGLYQSFSVTFGVTIRAQVPGTATFDTPFAPANQVLLSAGQVAHLVDLNMKGLAVIGGTTLVDGCQVTPLFPVFTGIQVADGTIVLQGCHAIGSSGVTVAGLLATNSTVASIDSSFRGGNTSTTGNGRAPGYGVYLSDSSFYGSYLTITGGSGTGGYPPRPAVKAVGTSSVWLSDTSLIGGVWVSQGTLPPLPPVCPIEAATGRLDRCTLAGSPCSVIPPTGGPVLGMHAPAPMTSPGAVSFEFRTTANAPVGVYLSTGLGFATLPQLEQPILLELATMLPFALAVGDAAGRAHVACAIPAGFAGLEFWFQGVSGTALPLQLSPVGGGLVR